jgi:hypothetical protein
VNCYSLCQEKADSCKSYGPNDLYEYNWIHPGKDECCGHCLKKSKVFYIYGYIFILIEFFLKKKMNHVK